MGVKLKFKPWIALTISLLVFSALTACGISPRVTAQERLFLNLSLELVDEYQLPKMTFEGTPVGGLSALTYDRQNDRFYVLSDDRSQLAPARFYTLKLILEQSEAKPINIERVDIEAVTQLRNEQGTLFPPGSIDPEGIALSPKKTLFITSEGIPSRSIAPLIGEFELQTGRQQQSLRIPQRYLFQTEENLQGVRENLGFEALTLSPSGLAKDDPFRLFTATESALLQDSTEEISEEAGRVRWLHYVLGSVGAPTLIAEHLYLLDPSPEGAIANGLTELVTLEREGYFLTLERTFGLTGSGGKIFQVVVGNATDTSLIESLKGNIAQVVPLRKKLLLDLGELGIELDNLEGMSLGPHLKDGSQSLIVLSDDNFRDNQVTQLLLFRLKKN